MIAALRARYLARHLNRSEYYPLTACTSSKKATVPVNDKNTVDHLQSISKVAYVITNETEIKRWTSQSFREGAVSYSKKVATKDPSSMSASIGSHKPSSSACGIHPIQLHNNKLPHLNFGVWEDCTPLFLRFYLS